MSLPSSDDLLKAQHRYLCAKYGVDDIEFDFHATERRDADEIKTRYSDFFLGATQHNDVEFRSPVVRWKIGTDTFCGAVPIHVKEVDRSVFLLSANDWVEDHPEMEKELMTMIKRSKVSGADEVL